MTETSTVPVSPTLIETTEQAVASLEVAETPEQIVEAVAVIAENIESLSAEELTAIAETVSNAPPEVKREFEEQVNIFGGGLDSYVPLGSEVTVGQRRALIAVGAVLVTAPIVSARRK